MSVPFVPVEHVGLDQRQGREVRSSRLLGTVIGAFAMVLAGCTSTAPESPAVTIPAPEANDRDASDVDAASDPATANAPHGRVVYGLTSPANGLMPSETGCDVSCRQVLSALADPLVAVGSNGAVVPMLLASIEPSDDYFTWTLILRDNVTFHDGTPLDAVGLEAHLDRCRFSPLTSAWFAPISATESTGQVLTLHMEEPWLGLPDLLATHPCSFVVKGTARDPIGTGPFRIDPESAATNEVLTGDGLRMVRYDDYWRGATGTGEGLPLLGAIEFTVQPDPDDMHRLRSGEAIDLYQVDGQTNEETAITSTLGTDTYSLVFNLASSTGSSSDPAVTASSVAADEACRAALANSIDRSRFVAEPHREATGPFGPDQIGFVEWVVLDEPDNPEALIETCLVALGGSGSVEILRADGEASTRIATAIQDQWERATGGRIAVATQVVDPTTLVQRALLGEFDVLLWRNNGGIHPEANFPWWHSSSIRPLGEPSFNIGRLADPEIDTALKALRVDDLPLAQQFAAEEITRAFNRTNAMVWLEWTTWSVVAGGHLSGFETQTSPDGVPLAPLVAGAHPWHGIRCDPGRC